MCNILRRWDLFRRRKGNIESVSTQNEVRMRKLWKLERQYDYSKFFSNKAYYLEGTPRLEGEVMELWRPGFIFDKIRPLKDWFQDWVLFGETIDMHWTRHRMIWSKLFVYFFFFSFIIYIFLIFLLWLQLSALCSVFPVKTITVKKKKKCT